MTARYPESERDRYEPPGCPTCGRRVAVVQWVDVTNLNDPEPVAMPVLLRCPTPGCVGGRQHP